MYKCLLFNVLICAWVLLTLSEKCNGISTVQSPGRRVCVIGAGIAGLTSAKYMKEKRINFTVLEATRYVGGTWRYEPKVGTDEYGLPLFGSMYKHLRTNLPKPAMELKGFPIPDNMVSYPSWEAYYCYIKSYVKRFKLEKHIKFLHIVINVKRVGNVWKVKYRHVPTETEFEEEFDFVIVGTGHFSKPNWPSIPGEELFKGTIIHSHDYRLPDPYRGRRVLIVGFGPSGMDIGMDVGDVSKALVHSHHSPLKVRTQFPPNYLMKPDIKKFNETGVIFIDNTYEDIDDVIYCTGFQYHYPFLDDTSELNITSHSVTPLYRYMVNINQPTMIMMSLVFGACLVVALDAQIENRQPECVTSSWCKLFRSSRPFFSSDGCFQARYATALINGDFILPPQEEMMAEWQKRADVLRSEGRPMSDIHFLGKGEDQYYANLSKESGIERVPPVFSKIRLVDMEVKLEDLYGYRNYAYTILDNETFARSLEEEVQVENNCYGP